MNYPESQTDILDDRPPEIIDPQASQWRQPTGRWRSPNEDSRPNWTEDRTAGTTFRQIGRGVLYHLDLDQSFGPQTPANQTSPSPRLTAPKIHEQRPQRPTKKQAIRRRIGAAALALSLGVAGFSCGGPKVVESLKNRPDEVVERTPTDDEICTIRRVGNQALLVVASEFTNDLSSRRGAASRIKHAVRDQDDDRFGICYDPRTNYSRVLTDEAVENLAPGRLVDWGDFPGRSR